MLYQHEYRNLTSISEKPRLLPHVVTLHGDGELLWSRRRQYVRSSSVDASVPLSWKSWACCCLQNVPKCRLETLLGPQVNYCSILEGQIEHWFRGIRMLRNVAKLSVSGCIFRTWEWRLRGDFLGPVLRQVRDLTGLAPMSPCLFLPCFPGFLTVSVERGFSVSCSSQFRIISPCFQVI